MDKVSIISPVYNSAKYLKQTIDSVLEQSYTNFELILINDASTDNSLDICKSYNDDRIVIINLEKNVGVCKARNIAIKQATGRYIAFLDTDDFWHKEKLKTQINIMKDKNESISCMSYYRVDEESNIISGINIPNKISYNDMLKNNYVACLTLVYDTKFFGKKYFEEIEKNEDYLLWLKMIKESKYILGINERLSYYRVLKKSRSSNKLKVVIVRWKIYREYEKLNIISSCYYFLNYITRAFIKNRRKDV